MTCAEQLINANGLWVRLIKPPKGLLPDVLQSERCGGRLTGSVTTCERYGDCAVETEIICEKCGASLDHYLDIDEILTEYMKTLPEAQEVPNARTY